MADKLQRVGLVFKADGTADFKKSLDQVNTVVQENRNAFNLAKAAWDDSTSAMDKLKDRQEYLTKQTDIYAQKVNVLQEELRGLESAETRNEKSIRKKQNQLVQAQTTLLNYEKGLKDVTYQLESGTAASEEEMKSLNKAMGNLTAKAKENETAFEALKSEYDENTRSIQKYGDQQKFLSGQIQNYESQVRTLEKQLEILESAEDRNEQAISQKRTELNQTKTSLNRYKDALDEVEEKLKSGSAKTEDYAKNLDGFGNKAKEAGNKLSGVSAAAVGVAGAVAATVPATEEYRKIMASLESSSELAGYTAKETEQIYRTLYGVLGDDQTAATTTANLQALGLTQQQLTEITNGTIGAWAKYGDSIPIDGLAESINETIKTAAVTGTFADVLNWAGTSEDAFNEKLKACKSESERTNLVMQELANQGLMQAGQKWQENNKNLVEGNRAQAEFQEATAELAETVAPIVTRITELVAGLLQKFNELPPSTQKIIGVIVILAAVIGPLLSGIGSMTLGIGGLTKGFGGAAPVIKSLWGVLKANPIMAIISLITMVVTGIVTLYNKCEWFRDGVNSIAKSIKNFFEGIWEALKDFFSFKWIPKIKLPHFKISGGFSLIPPKVPKVSVKWYAKGGILNNPTIFGQNGNTLMGGGEAGKEAVLPIDLLKSYIREENQRNNPALASMIGEALKELKLVAENNIYIGDTKIISVLTDMVIEKLGQKTRGQKAAKGKW